MFVLLPQHNLEWSSLSGYTLIMPAVSVGHIGQLTVDLLLNSIEPKPDKLAVIDHPVFTPVIGSDPYDVDNADLMTAAEVFINKEKRLIVIQIRSLLVKEYCGDFLTQLIDWIKTCSFEQVILLTSCHSYERIDSQLTGTPFRYSVTQAVNPKVQQELKALQWTPLELRTPVLSKGETKILSYPGGGFTNKLYKLCNESNIPLVTLLVFCAEGDNISDVLLVVNHLNNWLHIIQSRNETPLWKFPVSWKLLFGNPPPLTIF